MRKKRRWFLEVSGITAAIALAGCEGITDSLNNDQPPENGNQTDSPEIREDAKSPERVVREYFNALQTGQTDLGLIHDEGEVPEFTDEATIASHNRKIVSVDSVSAVEQNTNTITLRAVITLSSTSTGREEQVAQGFNLRVDDGYWRIYSGADVEPTPGDNTINSETDNQDQDEPFRNPRYETNVSGFVRQNADLLWATSEVTIQNTSQKRILGGKVGVEHPSYPMVHDIYNIQPGSTKKYRKDKEKLNTNKIERTEEVNWHWIYYEDRNKLKYENKVGPYVNEDSITAQYRVEDINYSKGELTISFALPDGLSISVEDIVRIDSNDSIEVSDGRVTLTKPIMNPNRYAATDSHRVNVVSATSEETVHLFPPAFDNVSIENVSVEISTGSAPYKITNVSADVSIEEQHSVHNPKIILSLTSTPKRTFYPSDDFKRASSNAGSLAKTNVLPESAVPDKFAEKEISESGNISISADRAVPLPIENDRRVTVLFCVGNIPVAYQDSDELKNLV